MPYLQLDLPFAVAPDRRIDVADRLARLYAEVMSTTPDRVSVAFRELGDYGVLRSGPGGPSPAVVVSCDVRRGRPEATRRALGDRLAALVADAFGWPADAVVVYFTEHAGGDIYRDGELMEDWAPGA